MCMGIGSILANQFQISPEKGPNKLKQLQTVFWRIFLAPDPLESQKKALKTRMMAQFPKTWAKTRARWIGAQGQVNLAKRRKHASYPQKAQNGQIFLVELEDLLNP